MSSKRFGSLLASLAFAALPAAQGFAIENVRVIPMDTEHGDTERVLENQTVVVEGAAIRWMGPASEATIPSGAQRIDGEGKTLIPGLIDMHVRLLSEQYITDSFAPTELEVMSANGVTTVRLMDGRPRYLALRDEVLAKELFAPTLYVGSPPLTARPTGRVFSGVIPEDSHEARALVREYKAAGYDFVHLGYDLRPVVHAIVVQEARAQELPVVGRVSWKTGLEDALSSGMQGEHLDQFFEWLMPDDVAYGPSGMGAWRARYWQPLNDIDDSRVSELARLVAESGTYHTPALLYHESGFIERRTAEDLAASSDDRFLSSEVEAGLFHAREQFERARPDQPLIDRYAELRRLMVKELDAAGVPLLAGSNAPDWGHVGGFALHEELRCMVEAGLTPYAALATATRNPAAWLGGAFGTIAVGNRADLVLLSSDPLADIANTKGIEGVSLRGRWYGRNDLKGSLDAAAKALSKAPLRPAVLSQR